MYALPQVAPRLRGRVAVLAPYWDFWAGSTPFDLRESRSRLLDSAVELISSHADVAWSGLVGAEAVSATVHAVTRAAVDAVVVVQTMATPPHPIFQVLSSIGHVPIVVWGARAHGRVASDFDHSHVTSEGMTVGTPMLTSMLVRKGMPFDLLTLTFDDPGLPAGLGRSIRAAVASSRLSRARIGRVGSPIAGYACVDLDSDHLEADIGSVIVPIEPAEFRDTFLAIDLPRIRRAADSVRDDFRIDGPVTAADVDGAARAFLALDDLAVRHQLDAGAFNCHVPEIRLGDAVGFAPCLALGCATTAGIPWSCAGDVVVAVAMHAVKALGGPAFYHELEAFDPQTGLFVLANTGEHDAGLDPGAVPELRINPWFPGPVASLCARISPPSGPATLVGFAQLEEPSSHRFIIASGEFVEGGFPATGTTNAAFRFTGGDAARSWRSWCQSGVNHHAVATTGDRVAEFSALANHLRVEMVEVRLDQV